MIGTFQYVNWPKCMTNTVQYLFFGLKILYLDNRLIC